MAGLTKDTRTGIYLVQFYDAERQPRRKKVSTGVRDARTGERLRRRWEAAYVEGEFDPWYEAPPPSRATRRASEPRERKTLAAARERFLKSRSHLAENTGSNYRRVTGWFVDAVGGSRPVADVDAADVEGWVRGRGVRPVTQANYLRHLRVFFRYCKSQDWSKSDATEGVSLERVPRRFPKALRPEQVEVVAAYADQHARDGARRSSAWAAPFIRLGAETALRRNELLNLRWRDVDFRSGNLTVACTDSFTSKSGAERRIPLSDRAAHVLDDLQARRRSRTGLVFEAGAGAVHPGTCSKTIKRFAVGAGVPELTPHVLRHSCLTWLVERGVPLPTVQRFAGHADVTTTMIYCSVADEVYADQVRSALAV